MSRKNFVQYHFVLREEFKKRIDNTAFLNGMSRATFIREILGYSQFVLEYYQRDLPDEDNMCEEVNADSEIWVWIPKPHRRKLLQIRSSCNIWSMAIIVRRMLLLFLDLIDRHGFQETCRLLENFKKLNQKYRSKIYKKEPHMWQHNTLNPVYGYEFAADNTPQVFKYLE